MRKSTLASLLTLFVLIPATLFLGTQVKGRWYYLISTMIIVELMLPFLVLAVAAGMVNSPSLTGIRM